MNKETNSPAPKLEQMTFGVALSALKGGLKVARSGWNGKGMFVYYVPANAYPVTTAVAKNNFGEDVLMTLSEAYIAMKTVDSTVVPWLASQSDILSNDWEVVE